MIRLRALLSRVGLTGPVLAGLLAIVVVVGGIWWWRSGDEPKQLTLNELQSELSHKNVGAVTLYNTSNSIQGDLRSGGRFQAAFPREYSDELTQQLLDAGAEVTGNNEDASLFETFLTDLLPTLLIVGVFIWFVSQMQGGGRNRFGKASARKAAKNRTDVTFADVAGADEAVEELQEIKEFLQNPSRFQALGAKIPRGVLLFGPPGTGKTLLARAVAGEAGVPFLTISGSDFVEMFVGVGAARVRDLFRQAREMAPAIVFVDEIDAVGRHRGAGVGGGHDEREQTLNQLLVEMDGFEADSGVILMAATNRPDILDPALLRPGRFDRQVVVDAPDKRGREAILRVHAKNKPLAPDVSLSVLARRTPGFTGADLANVVNEGALLAGRRHGDIITGGDLNEAVERVMAGPQRKSRVMSPAEQRVTAYHEGGHALVAHALPGGDPVHKVSIVARGRALGWTLTLPEEDRYSHTRAQLTDRLAMFLGGRTAEELVFGEITTGAADDIDRASKLARAMVTEYGMSDAVGPQRLGHHEDEPFLGREHVHQANYSEEVASVIDAEVAKLLSAAHDRAKRILVEYRATLDRLAEALVERETLDETDLAVIFSDIAPAPAP